MIRGVVPFISLVVLLSGAFIHVDQGLVVKSVVTLVGLLATGLEIGRLDVVVNLLDGFEQTVMGHVVLRVKVRVLQLLVDGFEEAVVLVVITVV